MLAPVFALMGSFVDCDGKEYRAQVVFQVRMRPGCYSIGQETVGAGASAPFDPTGTYPNASIEWYTKEVPGIILTGLLVKCTPV
jgi:hypothetical protein